MRKILISMVALMATLSVNAQYLNDSETPFSEGKFYVSASASSASFAYSKSTDFKIGLNAKAGYLFMDNLMALGVVEFSGQNNFDILTTQIGAGARYYFENCGVFLGLLAKYAHVKNKVSDSSVSFSDFRPEIHAGYCFFLGKHVTLDPEVYFEHSFKDSDYSGFGLRVGIGIFF